MATPKARTQGFTLIETLLAIGLFAIMSIVAWENFSTGNKSTVSGSEALSAIQNSINLMDSVQQDIRQLSISNDPRCAIVPCSLLFSTNAKSIMFRKASAMDTAGRGMAGAAITVVVYQLMQSPTIAGAYTMRRLERTTDGTALLNTSYPETDFHALALRDIRWDMAVRLIAGGGYQLFLRISISAVNTGQDQNNARCFFLSNLFEASSPPFLLNANKQQGFARPFLSNTTLQAVDVLPGNGYFYPLPPSPTVAAGGVNLPGWSDASSYVPFQDYLDTSGNPQNFPPAPGGGGAATDPFDDSVGIAGGQDRQNFCTTATDYLQALLENGAYYYHGQITGNVTNDPTNPADNPPNVQPYNVSFTLDSTSIGGSPIKVQIANALAQVCALNYPTAVQNFGHMLGAQVSNLGTNNYQISSADAQGVINNQ